MVCLHIDYRCKKPSVAIPHPHPLSFIPLWTQYSSLVSHHHNAGHMTNWRQLPFQLNGRCNCDAGHLVASLGSFYNPDKANPTAGVLSVM